MILQSTKKSIHNRITKISDLNTSILQLLEVSAEIQPCSCTTPEESASANEKAAQQQQEYKRRHLEEVGVGGLVGEGQLLATPSAAAASSRPDVATVEMYPG